MKVKIKDYKLYGVLPTPYGLVDFIVSDGDFIPGAIPTHVKVSLSGRKLETLKHKYEFDFGATLYWVENSWITGSKYSRGYSDFHVDGPDNVNPRALMPAAIWKNIRLTWELFSSAYPGLAYQASEQATKKAFNEQTGKLILAKTDAKISRLYQEHKDLELERAQKYYELTRCEEYELELTPLPGEKKAEEPKP